MIRRNVILITAFITLTTQLWAADFDRQAFLAAVKERFKSEQSLMDLRSVYDSTLRIDAPAPTVASQDWQKNLMTIPSIGQFGPNASFGIALGYLASQELRIPFSGKYPYDAVIWIDNNGARFNRVYVNPKLLQTVFDEKSSCDSTGVPGSGPVLEFANSLCRDLKQVLADAKSEIKDQQLLTAEKRDYRTAIQRTTNLLKQADGFDNQSVVQASIVSLESALSGNNLSEIRAKAQGLTAASRDLEQFIAAQKVKTEALANARQAANEELTKTQSLLMQAQGYGKQNQVASAQKPLELALAGENIEDIKGKTQTLAVVNRDLGKYIQDLKAVAEKKRQQENDIRAFSATKERATKVIESAKAEVAQAAQKSGDGTVASAAKETSQSVSQLVAAIQKNDPKDEPQVSALADRVTKSEQNLKSATRQATVLSSATGKRIYQGCMAWAQRKGIASPVRVFKDDAANNAINQGEQLCRCTATEISGEKEITDEAKLEIAHQFETTDRMNNQQLALVVGVASTKCQVQAMERLANQK